MQRAASWAAEQVGGGRLWIDDGDTLCGTFVENAYGVTGIYGSANAMYRSLGSGGDTSRHTLAGLQHAPLGAIVFFASNARNGYEGHVGIYVGSGQFVGVGSGGHIRRYSVAWWSNSLARYIGWAYPPANWPGPGKA
jgi:cell wall-associated NlpC family hydrolase